MQGQQNHQPMLFSVVQIEKFIPKNHLLRRIDETIDFSFVKKITESLYCGNNGRPSVDPEVFIRILLIMYLYGIPSDRQVCEEIEFNLAYRWFCKLSLEDKVPDHSSLTRIRDRFGEKTFKNIFLKILDLCKEKGLIAKDSPLKVMMDGSLIEANASLYSLVTNEEFERLKKEEKETGVKKPYIKERIMGLKFSNKTHTSTSDSDARLAGLGYQQKKLRYKTHEVIDAGSRVILHAKVTNGAISDGSLLKEHIEEAQKNLNMRIDEVTADRGYGYGENLQYLKDQDIKSFVPRFHKEYIYL